MSSKLKSRKFWMAVIGAVLTVANDGLDMNLDTKTILAFAAIIVGYLIAEGTVDAVRASKQ